MDTGIFITLLTGLGVVILIAPSLLGESLTDRDFKRADRAFVQGKARWRWFRENWLLFIPIPGMMLAFLIGIWSGASTARYADKKAEHQFWTGVVYTAIYFGEFGEFPTYNSDELVEVIRKFREERREPKNQ